MPVLFVRPTEICSVAGKPEVLGVPKASIVFNTGCCVNGTPATAAPGEVVNASVTAEPMTLNAALFVATMLPLAGAAASVFGPAWFKLKSLKCAIPLASVERVNVPAKVPVPLASEMTIAAFVSG